MKSKRQLNINNTFRSLNFNVFNPYENNIHVLSQLSNKAIKNMISKGTIDDNVFIINLDDILHNKYFNTIFNAKCKIIYNAKNNFPIAFLFKLGNRKNFEVLYPYKSNYSKEDLTNIQAVSQIYNVGIYIKVNSNVKITKYLFSLNDLRYTLAYKAYFDYTSKHYFKGAEVNKDYQIYDTTVEDKTEDFSLVHEVLARWRIQCWISCLNHAEYDKIREKVVKLR